MRRAPADALRALAEMPIAGSPPRLSTHPGRFLAVLLTPSRSALTSNPHSAPSPAAAQLPATSCLGAFWTPGSSACLEPRYCRRPKTCTTAVIAQISLTHLFGRVGKIAPTDIRNATESAL